MARSPRDDDEDLPPRPRRPPPAARDERGEAVEPADRAHRRAPRRDEDEDENDRPRSRRRDEEEDEDEDDRPRARRRRRDEEEDEDDDRPRRRRRKDAIEKIIPYHNPTALAAYYCGVFSLIPVLGNLLGPVALVLSIFGIRASRVNKRAGGIGHAIAGLVLGLLTTVAWWVCAFMFGPAIWEAFRR